MRNVAIRFLISLICSTVYFGGLFGVFIFNQSRGGPVLRVDQAKPGCPVFARPSNVSRYEAKNRPLSGALGSGSAILGGRGPGHATCKVI